MKNSKLLLLLYVVIALFFVADMAYSLYTVDNLGDFYDGLPYSPGDGNNTLRKCIILANLTGVDTIEFDISGTISPASPLPDLTDNSTKIIAGSQWIGSWPGGEPGVTLDGSHPNAGPNGFSIKGVNGYGCRISGMFITNFSGSGIYIWDGANKNHIGGTADGYRNIISGNGTGVLISKSQFCNR